MTSRPRTSGDFDKLGNVWHVGDISDLRRLGETEDFIRRHARNPGTVMECGPLHGHLTSLLLAALSQATIHLVEIAPANAQVLRDHFSYEQRVVVHEADMASLARLPIPPVDLVLLIECLYYLSPSERQSFVRTLHAMHPRARVVVSTPLTGGDYFTEDALLALFNSYRMVGTGEPQRDHRIYAFAPRRFRLGRRRESR